MYNAPQLSKAKSGNHLFNRIKQEQSNLEEQLVIEFIHRTLNVSVPLGELQQHLKDGVILCNLVNYVRPNTIKIKTQKTESSFIQMDNISRFLQGVLQV
ncbi:uncharacterized protein B0P05DRAFT_561034 [Gilbertella persicaria]|uniref:uncharacterized protein n=1 Tax=Gilbertella persicaria TaxID=101096 RepID=UPI00221F310B|nr:uncharacterized protein B0P05DRAFT_561034 [Gilbertella persicaria]KAI8054143.1 hypothetical protein B0P05DRAFT_561034 [Gilbertella persicaria]